MSKKFVVSCFHPSSRQFEGQTHKIQKFKAVSIRRLYFERERERGREGERERETRGCPPVELREKQGGTCEAGANPYLPTMRRQWFQAIMVDGWRVVVRLVVVAGGAAGDREADGLGRWNSRCLRVFTIESSWLIASRCILDANLIACSFLIPIRLRQSDHCGPFPPRSTSMVEHVWHGSSPPGID